MGKKYKDRNGFLHLEETPISRVQIAPYLGKQIDAKRQIGLKPDKVYFVYRPAKELFNADTMKSFEGMPFRVGHQMLGEGGGNVKKVDNDKIDGTFLNVHRSKERPDYLMADIVIYTDRALKAIANGTKELSLGYRCAYVKQAGEYNGEHYDFVQTNIVANHLALVPHGRAGSSVCVEDEAILTEDGLVVTCDSLPEEIQIMEENEKKAKDKLKALLTSSEENVQDCLDYCDLTPEQKEAVKAMKNGKKAEDTPAEDKACKGCGKDEMPPTPPPAPEAEEEKPAEEPAAPAPAEEKPAEEKPAEEPAAPAPVEEKPAEEKPAEEPAAPAPVEEKPAVEPKTFTQDELDAEVEKARKEGRKDGLRAKALAEAVGEDCGDCSEADVARKACKKIKGLEQYAQDGVPDGKVLAAVRGYLARQVEDDEKKDKEPAKSKKTLMTVAQDEAIAKTPASFSAAKLNQYLGAK